MIIRSASTLMELAFAAGGKQLASRLQDDDPDAAVARRRALLNRYCHDLPRVLLLAPLKVL